MCKAINYALSVWGPMIKLSDMKKLSVQQNNSIRILFKVGRRTNLSQFYKRAQILRITDQVKLALLKISFRYSQDKLPTRITNLFNLTNHDYMTRNRNSLRAPHHTTFQYSRSFLGQAPGCWINLPDGLKNKTRVGSFIKGVTKMKLNDY